MTEANQEVPSWLRMMASERRYSSVKTNQQTSNSGGRFSSGFGARDYRTSQPAGQAHQGPTRHATSFQAPPPARSCNEWWEQ